MAASYTAKVLASFIAAEEWTMDGAGGTATIPHKVAFDTNLAAGTAAGQVAMAWHDSVSLPVGTGPLQLDGLTQLDAAGATLHSVAFGVVKGIMIKNTSASGKLTIGGGTGGGGAADAWAGAGTPFVSDASRIDIPFGGLFVWYEPAGTAVANSTADVLEFEATSATQTFQIAIIGE